MFEASFPETRKALEAIRVDGRAGRNVLDEERDDCLGLEVWDHSHADAPRALATLLYRNQDEGRSSPLELSASAETSLLAPNPRVDAANSIRVFGGWTLQIQMGPFQV